MKCVIPFSGFYNSVHDVELTQQVGQLLDTVGHGEPNQKLFDLFWRGDCIDWARVHCNYARHYAGNLARELGTRWTFAKLSSPREYNFETDRIFVDVSETESCRWFDYCDPVALDRIAAERHTSRSGFISFYSPDWRTWSDPRDWEPEQLQTLLLAWIDSSDTATAWRDSVETHGEGIAELYLMQDGHDYASQCVDDGLATEGARLVRIADYLLARHERGFYARRAPTIETQGAHA